MATITLQVSLAGPTDNGGSCRVLYAVTNADGVDPAIFVIKRFPPEYQGATPMQIWQHVAYADELTTVPTSSSDTIHPVFLRKATVTVEYASLKLAQEAIQSIRSQIQRLVNEINDLAIYAEPTTYIISSTN